MSNKLVFQALIGDRKYPLELILEQGNTVSAVLLDGKPVPLQVANTETEDTPLDKEYLAEMMPFFSEITPPWFQGCMELREAYQDELQNLEAQYKDSECPGCKKGALIRKYARILSTRGIRGPGVKV
jgi:hypothetical protein